MNAALVDAGPLIALFDRSDQFHVQSRQLLERERVPLVSTWPVVTEATHILDFDVRAQTALLEWIHRGAVEIIEPPDLRRVIELMQTYRDAPMDFADATLVAVAEERSIRTVISIDSHFAIYRTRSGEMLENRFVR